MAEQEELRIERQLPYNEEAEMAIIGSCLTSSDAVAESCKDLKNTDLYLTANREIFAVICELFGENSPIDFVTVNERLLRHNKLDAIGGTQYLASLATHTHTTQNIKYYIDIVKNQSLLRNLISACNDISNRAFNAEDDVRDIVAGAENEIFKISQSNTSHDAVLVEDVLYDVYEELEQNYRSDAKINGIDTGFTMLNNNTGGFHPGELIIIAGRPGMGKSSFAVNIAEHVSIKDHNTVAIFNLEMSKTQIVKRIITSQAQVSAQKLQSGDLSVDDWKSIANACSNISPAKIFIDETPGIKVNEIKSKCMRIKQTNDLSLVVIDYLQLMDVEHRPGRSDSRQNDISEISRSLKIMAKELNVPVIALSQLSRAVESRTDKKPQLSDLRESGAIEQDADLVMFLYRDDYYKKEASERPGIADCIIAKNRSGQTASFELGWKGEYTKFLNIEYRADDEQK